MVLEMLIITVEMCFGLANVKVGVNFNYHFCESLIMKLYTGCFSCLS